METPMRILIISLVSLLTTVCPASSADPPAKDTPADKAINKALEFLDNVQDKTDGSWRAGRNGRNPAVTSLAVMAFLSAGHVPGEGKYGETVEKGIRWVLKAQQATNGLIANDSNYE